MTCVRGGTFDSGEVGVLHRHGRFEPNVPCKSSVCARLCGPRPSTPLFCAVIPAFSVISPATALFVCNVWPQAFHPPPSSLAPAKSVFAGIHISNTPPAACVSHSAGSPLGQLGSADVMTMLRQAIREELAPLHETPSVTTGRFDTTEQ